MSKDPTIAIAWAVPVSLQMLGARLEAYVRNKDSVIFRLCSQKLPSLPPEVWRNIGEQAAQSDYEESLKWWQAADDCCQHHCHCDDDLLDAHHKRVDRLMGKIGQRAWVSPFSKCKKVFEDDFGLNIRFDVCRDLSPEHGQLRIILAHIILPIKISRVKYSDDGDRKYPIFSIFSSMIIDRAKGSEPTLNQKEQFKTALKTLHLQPMLHEIQEQEYSLEELQSMGTSRTNYVNEAYWLTLVVPSLTDWPKQMVLSSGLLS